MTDTGDDRETARPFAWPLTLRVDCGACGSTDLRLALDLGSAPLADEFPREPAPDQERFPLRMALCGACGLGQLLDVVSDDLLWGGDYAFRTGSSSTLRLYFREYAAWLSANYGRLLRDGLMVEIGCNDGTLMRQLTNGVPPIVRSVVGVDPAAGPCADAREAGLTAHQMGFGLGAASRLIAAHGRAQVVVANNVVAHVADLDDFFAGLSELLDSNGVAIVEVQYLPDLLLGNDFPLLYHEHRSYFSLRALHAVAQAWGLEPRDAWLTDAQGGSLRVELRHARDPGMRSQAVTSILDDEAWLTTGGAVAGLQSRADRLRSRLLAMVHAERAAGRTVAGYGASAKASTLLAWTGLGRAAPDWGPGVARGTADNPLPWVVDTTPGKVGRYMPGTSIPVLGRGDAPDGSADTYLLMIYNYLGHVLRNESAWLSRPGHRMIVPVPIPRLI